MDIDSCVILELAFFTGYEIFIYRVTSIFVCLSVWFGLSGD